MALKSGQLRIWIQSHGALHLMNERQFQKTFQEAEAFSNGYDLEMIGSSRSESTARFGNNEISQHVQIEEMSLTIRVQKGRRQGTAVCNDSTPGVLKKTIEKAMALAECADSPSDLPEMLPLQRYISFNGFSRETLKLTPLEKVSAIQEIIRQCRPKKLTAAGLFSHGVQVTGIANSRGLFAFHTQTLASFSITIMGQDSSGWAEGTHWDIQKISPSLLAAAAIEKEQKGRKPKAISPGRYTVLLEPAASAEILLFMMWDGLGALPYLEGRSFLSGKMGEKVVSEAITLMDDPYHAQTIGLPFDYEGMPRQQVTLIEDGMGRRVVHDRNTARAAGETSTGHALPQPNTSGPLPLHLVMRKGDKSLCQMIAETDRGLLISRFHYTNLIDPIPLSITGMTRDGTFLIEKGRIKYPVKNLRFTESIIGALSRVEAVGDETVYASSFWGAGVVAPALKIRDFNFSSGTPF